MARRSLPRKVTYFQPVPPRLARNTIIESTFDVGRRFRCTMRVDCGQLDPGAVIRPVSGEWRPHMPERLDDEELADWLAGRNAVYQLAALTIGARRRSRQPIEPHHHQHVAFLELGDCATQSRSIGSGAARHLAKHTVHAGGAQSERAAPPFR